MAAVAVKVPSSDILAVGVSINPVTPKSDADRGIENTNDRYIKTTFLIETSNSIVLDTKKGIKDALLTYNLNNLVK